MSNQQQDLQPVEEFTEQRKRAMTQRALEYTVEIKQRNARSLEHKLWRITRSIEALDPKSCTGNMLRELVTATEEFDLIQLELADLYKQDKYGVYEGQALLVSENTTLRHARELITKIKIAQKPDKSSETTSVRSHDSRRSHASRASTSSSVARLRAAAEAAAAKEQAEYERLIAEKENEMKQREAEEEKRRQQARAQHERDIAVMSANKRVAVANARLKAIQESMLEKEINDPLELPNMDITDCQERTRAWVHSITPKADDTLLSRVPHTPTDGHTHKSPYTPKDGHTRESPQTPKDGHTHESPYTPKDGHTQESPCTPQDRHTLKSPHFLGERRTPAEGYTPGGGHIPIVNSTAKVIQKTLVVMKTGIANHFSEFQNLIKSNNKIPHYARNFKKEYIFIRGLNKEFMYFINKLDKLNDGLFESNTADRIKYIMKRFLKAQEKGKIKDISKLKLASYDYSFIQEFYFNIKYEFEFGDNTIDVEFLELLGKIYNKIKIELVFSDYYGEGKYV